MSYAVLVRLRVCNPDSLGLITEGNRLPFVRLLSSQQRRVEQSMGNSTHYSRIAGSWARGVGGMVHNS
jgi:hypothetical protein